MKCVECGTDNNDHTILGAIGKPEKDDISICMYCGHISIATGEVRDREAVVREPTEAELLEILKMPLIQKALEARMNIMSPPKPNTFKIVEDSEMDALNGDDESVIVCIPVSDPKFASRPHDNIEEHQCFRCGVMVTERPHNPKNVKRICMPCLETELPSLLAKGGMDVRASKTSMREAKEFIAMKQPKGTA